MERYSTWTRRVHAAMEELAAAQPEPKKRALEAFLAETAGCSREAGLEGEPAAAGGRARGSDVGREIAPADVERRIVELHHLRLLPHRRSWRVRMSLEAAQPHHALAELWEVEKQARAAIAEGSPLEDPWTIFAESLDACAEVANSTPYSIERAVLMALAEQPVAGANGAGSSSNPRAARPPAGLRAADVWALKRLPGAAAARLVQGLPCVAPGSIPAAVEVHLAAPGAIRSHLGTSGLCTQTN